ncbi:MAG: ATP-binding protein [Candidatus Sumerlaeia bacterium]
MNTNSDFQTKALTQYLCSRPSAEFFGRDRELDAVARLADDAQRGNPRWLVFEGPAGSGRTELMKQAAVGLVARRPAALPVWLDLADGSRSLLAAAIHQVLAQAAALDPAETIELAPGRLGPMLRQAGLGALERLVAAPDSEPAWRGLLRAARERSLPQIILFVDGMDSREPPAAVLNAARAEGRPVVLDGAPPAGGEEIEFCPVEPLAIGDALALAHTTLQGCGRGFEPALLRPILARLGPWPGWARAWAERLRRASRGCDWTAVRLAEQTYIGFLSDSAWSRALSENIRKAVGPMRCGRALELVRLGVEEGRPLEAERAAETLGIGEDRLDAALAALERLGLVRRRGLNWEAPRAGAIADWARLELARAGDGARAAATPMEMLAANLTASRETAAEPPSIHRIFSLMRGQVVPEALFHLADYHEALGALPAEQRHDAVMKSARTLSLPEVIGVAEWRRPTGPRLVFARAYRGGHYQRSHEEVWIGIDLMDSRALTTSEIHEALAAAELLERQLGAGRYVYWLLAGADASPEALQWLHDRRVFCSGREQLEHLAELLEAAARPVEADLPPKARIVGLNPLQGSRPLPARTAPSGGDKSHTITIPARSESEHDAVHAAETFAREAGFDDSDVGRIKTAVLEGILNAIEHSADPEKVVTMELVLTPAALEITIDNEGRRFDPLAVEEPDPRAKLTAVNKRGWGICLMKRFMDEVAYEPIAGGTRLRLVKRRQQPKPQSAREAVETGISHL